MTAFLAHSRLRQVDFLVSHRPQGRRGQPTRRDGLDDGARLGPDQQRPRRHAVRHLCARRAAQGPGEARKEGPSGRGFCAGAGGGANGHAARGRGLLSAAGKVYTELSSSELAGESRATSPWQAGKSFDSALGRVVDLREDPARRCARPPSKRPDVGPSSQRSQSRVAASGRKRFRVARPKRFPHSREGSPNREQAPRAIRVFRCDYREWQGPAKAASLRARERKRCAGARANAGTDRLGVRSSAASDARGHRTRRLWLASTLDLAQSSSSFTKPMGLFSSSTSVAPPAGPDKHDVRSPPSPRLLISEADRTARSGVALRTLAGGQGRGHSQHDARARRTAPGEPALLTSVSLVSRVGESGWGPSSAVLGLRGAQHIAQQDADAPLLPATAQR